MSQRLGCLATETFKVLVFLINEKANKQSVIYVLTGVPVDKRVFSINFSRQISEIRNILSKNSDFNPKVDVCWFIFFFFMIVI